MPDFRFWNNQPRHLAHILAVIIIVLFLVSGIASLPHYGMTWDESLGNFFFGERYLRFMTSFEEKYLDFKALLPMHAEQPLNLYLSHFRIYPEEFPALLDVASAASMYLFSYRLGWLDPVDAFHLFTILLTSLFLYLFYRFTTHRIGNLAGLFALTFLATFPRLWGDMHINVKDVPEMVLFGLTLMAYWRWSEKPSWKRAALVGLACGAALGVKANAIFLPVMIVLGATPLTWRAFWRHVSSFIHHFFAMVMITAGVFFLSWPFLYANPLNAIKYFSYIKSQGGRIALDFWNWQPLKITIATMPEIMLVCLLAGFSLAGILALRNQNRFMRFALVWCLFPILRISLPPSVNFDGVRHFLEFLPAAALLAGVGASGIIDWIARRNKSLKLPAGIILISLIVASFAFSINNYGSYQYVFFNTLTGGLPGAAKHFGASEATDYWGSSYRQGIQWINENAPANSVLYVPIAGHIVDVIAPLWLRPDIKVIFEDQLASHQSQDRTIYIMFITRTSDNSIVQQCLENRDAIFEIQVQGVPFLLIYQW